MVVQRTLGKTQLRELKDHRENTATDYIKVYTLAQLAFMDGADQRTIKHSKKYLPVRVDSGPAMDRFRRGQQEKPYRIMYIRLDEIKYLFNKRTGNKLVVELQ